MTGQRYTKAISEKFDGVDNRGVGRRAVVAVMLLLFGALGCDAGCETGESVEVRFGVDESFDEEVVAVARLLDFEERHFDMQHWLAEGVEGGVFRDRDDLEHSIPSVPTADIRQMIEDTVGDDAERIDWQGDMDIAVWQPEDDGEPWRWAVSISLDDGASLDGFDESQSIGGARVTGSDDVVEVYERSAGDDGASRFVADIPGAETADGGGAGRSVAVSNVAPGVARIADAVALTGDSGQAAAELYLWPRRTTITERYNAIGQEMDQELAQTGHNKPPARVGLMRFQSQIQHALGTAENWPKMVRLAKRVERDDETGGAESVEFIIDIERAGSALVDAVVDAIDGSEYRRRNPVDDAALQIDIDAGDGGLADIFADGVDPLWAGWLTGRSEGELMSILGKFEQALEYVDGGLTVAIADSPLPMGMSAETYVAVETSDAAQLQATMEPVYRWVIEEYWPSLLNLDSRIVADTDVITIDSREVEVHRHNFVIGHGFGVGGVCSAVVDGTYLAYLGVRPCQRLTEIGDVGWSGESARAISYRGGLQGLVDGLYASPGEGAVNIFDDITVDIAMESHPGGGLRLTTEFDDLTELAQVVEGVPRLRAHWSPEVVVEPQSIVQAMELDVARYQEPSMAAVGVPGWGGAVPGPMLLGLPFSTPPTTPNSFERHFFADPDERDQSHGHHSHPH